MPVRDKRIQFPSVDGLLLERRMNPKYFCYDEDFKQLPGINADYTLTSATLVSPLNRNIEVQGTNHTTALATFAAGMGCTLTTATADGDNMSIWPHADTKQSAVNNSWLPSDSICWMVNFVTGASVVDRIDYTGFKLTNTPVVATDDDQFFFRCETGATTVDGSGSVNSGKWQLVYSIGGVDATIDTGVTIAASTRYTMLLIVDRDRIGYAYLNDTLIPISASGTTSTTALTAAAALKFVHGVEVDGATAGAKATTIRNFHVSKLYS